MALATEVPSKKSMDLLGIVISVACVIHCLFIPMVASLAPALTAQLQNEWVHFALLGALIPIALISFINGYKSHLNILPTLIAVVGMCFLLGAVVLERFHIEGWETILTVSGSAVLVVGHVFNLKAYRAR